MSAEALPLYGKCAGCGRPLAGANLRLDGLEPVCVHCWENPKAEDDTCQDPLIVAVNQIGDAKMAMDRPLSEYVHLPFPSVNALVGAIPPGDVGFICAFSGRGKTTFVTSAINGFLAQGKRVYCLPLESRPLHFRTHLACKALGYHAGMVLTGEYKRSEPEKWPFIREQLVAELDKQQKGDMAEQLYVSPVRAIDTRAVKKAAKHAAKLGADVLIVDHIDQVSTEGTREESGKVADFVLTVTQDEGFAAVCTTQANSEGQRHDRLAEYMVPRAHQVWMGGKKRHVAAWMGGLGRCLKLDGVPPEEIAAVRAGTMEAWRILEPNCMVFGSMKSRNFGEREGHKTWLRVENGCVAEDEALVSYAKHGIGRRLA